MWAFAHAATASRNVERLLYLGFECIHVFSLLVLRLFRSSKSEHGDLTVTNSPHSYIKPKKGLSLTTSPVKTAIADGLLECIRRAREISVTLRLEKRRIEAA